MYNVVSKLPDKKRFNIDDLIKIMTILRGEKGCPWDLIQTHKSIRNNLIEETYEVVEAIDENDDEMLKEELGDLLLQIIFHSQIAKDDGRFNINDVADGICRKLILRHPHIFSNVIAKIPEEVLKNWDEIKKEEKGHKSHTDVLNSVSKALPSLVRSQKVQHKAAKAGFDWPDVSGAIEKLEEETNEVKYAIEQGDKEHIFEEIGDLIFAVVNVSRKIHVDAEEALYKSCEKFIGRFSKVDAQISQSGKKMENMSLEELDEYWEKAKKM